MSFVADLLKGIDEAFSPLREGLSSPEAFGSLLADLGWSLDENADIDRVADAFSGIMGGMDALSEAVDGIEGLGEDASIDEVASAIKRAVDALKSLIKSIGTLGASPSLPAPLNDHIFWGSFAEDLIANLTFRFVEEHYPRVFSVLNVMGVFTRTRIIPADATPDKVPYIALDVHWDRLVKLISDPGSLISEIYGWKGSLDYIRFLDAILTSAQSMGLPASLAPPSTNLLDDYYSKTSDFVKRVPSLQIPLYWGLTDDGTDLDVLSVDIAVFPIPPKDAKDASPEGLAIFPAVDGIIPASGISLNLEEGVDLEISGNFADREVRAEVYPDKASVTINPPLSAPIEALARIKAVAPPGNPWILMGSKDSSHIEVSEAHIGLAVNGKIDEPDIRMDMGADKAAFVLNLGESDGFLKDVIGSGVQRLDLGFDLAWSNRSGLSFNGQAKLLTSIPVHMDFGSAAHLSAINLGLAPFGGKSIAIEASVSGGVSLGPVSASIDRMGIQAEITPLDKPEGNLGFLDIGFGFKPPTGLGISIDAGPITGGGFISFDPANGRYSGALQLKIYEISVSAIGILDTRLPGGAEGYSFIIMIFGEFAPIQLGLGFTLSGVGGLAGIHRTVAVEVLQAGIRSHKLDSILFPDDPVGNAPKIINDISAVFPPARGRYIFGPMALIGWGTPNIITANLGIILELPDPVRLIILGQISAVLPSEEIALIELHIDVVGVIDFTNKHMAIDSSLHDSHIIGFSISGDMALRLDWGDNPNFALAIGGFNPHFHPPPGFPALRRITLAIGWGPSELTLQSYFAITSNTLQFGAQIDLCVNGGFFNIKGWLGLDALIVFSPFSFIADFRAGVALRVRSFNLLGVSLDGHIAGPSPWHVWGEACISVLFWDICVSFDLETGEERPNTVLPEDIWERLKDAIKDGRNWSSDPAPMAFRVVSLAPPAAGGPAVIVDPVGSVSFHQKVLPLNRKITKFGEAPPKGPDSFNLDRVRLGPAGEEVDAASKILQDFFAPAQFEDMSDSDKLSRPSFVKMDAGVTLESDSVKAGERVTEIKLLFETHIIEEKGSIREDGASTYELLQEDQLSMILRGAAAHSALRTTGLQKFTNMERERVLFEDEGYVVASIEDISVKDVGKGKQPMTKDAAYLALYDYVNNHPEERGGLQVVPMAEART